MITMLTGDCREVLRTLPDASVHCVVTSPPYWGLRDYGTATWQGGDPRCDHLKTGRTQNLDKLGERLGCGGGHSTSDNILEPFKDRCGKCGAIRIDAQLGLEPDFNAYVANMVGVFREVRRVLRDDGTLWLNLGDSYANGGRKTRDPGQSKLHRAFEGDAYADGLRPDDPDGLKPKDLCGIPWRVAFALQADGWYLRQDIIWSKPNPMPESVTDRCTKAHEYLFLLSKRERYYYDAEAIAEASIRAGEIPGGCYAEKHGDGQFVVANRYAAGTVPATRNKRSVWEVTTQPFSEAHFATFPPALIEPCIKAGTSEKGCCGKCGKPWVRQTETDYKRHENWFGDKQGARHSRGSAGNGYNEPIATRTTGWQPACACGAEPMPCTVLDPFAGAGTTGLVADRLQRNAILIELNPTYAAMGERRIVGDAPLFVEVAP